MQMPDVAGWIQAHRTPVLAGGAGLAVVLGLRARSARRSPAPAASTGGASGVATTTAYAGRGGVYDSTANDVYNSIEPQIASLSGSLSQLAGRIAGSQSLPDGTSTAASYPGAQTNYRYDAQHRVVGVVQAYDLTKTPSGHAAGVTGLDLTIDPVSKAVTSGSWWKGADKVALPEWVLAQYGAVDWTKGAPS